MDEIWLLLQHLKVLSHEVRTHLHTHTTPIQILNTKTDKRKRNSPASLQDKESPLLTPLKLNEQDPKEEEEIGTLQYEQVSNLSETDLRRMKKGL